MPDANIAHEATLAEEALPIGTTLSGDQFTITGLLGAGGFGITYRAKDNVLGRNIVVKECFPTDLCFRENKTVVARSKTYAKPVYSVVKMFMREARSLARLRHPNIVGVHRAFEENGTAYMVLDLIDGRDLFDILEAKDTKLSPARVQDILIQLLDAVEKVHEMDLLHRDISPDNIIIEKNGTPVLIDFGAARRDASRHTRAISSLLVVKDGYSPQEFYVAGSNQSQSSDLYALAATFYHVLTGQPPPNSQSRMVEIAGRKPDPCIPLAGRIKGYDPAFLEAVDLAMQIHPADRLQSAAKWKTMIPDAGDAALPRSRSRPNSQEISLELEMSLTRLVEETNDEVRKISQIPEEPKSEPAPVRKSSKPEWVEEFNQESVAVANEPKQGEPKTTPEDGAEIPDSSIYKDVGNLEPGEVAKVLREFSQNRVVSEPEYQVLDIETDKKGHISSAATRDVPSSQTPSDESVVECSGSRPTKWPLRLVAGLLLCFGFLFLLENPPSLPKNSEATEIQR